MIKEFGNCTDDSSDGDFGRYEGASPSNVPSKDAGDDNSDDSDGSDNGDKTQEKGVIREGLIDWQAKNQIKSAQSFICKVYECLYFVLVVNEL